MFCERYWGVAYAYFRRAGSKAEDAADQTQGFFTDVVLGGRLLDLADQSRGTFRSFLRRALLHYSVDRHRRECGRRPGFRPRVDGFSSGAEDGFDVVAREASSPAQAFERAYSLSMVEAAVERTRQKCMHDEDDRRWRAFLRRIIDPLKRGAVPPSLEQLAADLGASDISSISTDIQTMKRRFRVAFREVIAESLDDETAVEEEMMVIVGNLRG